MSYCRFQNTLEDLRTAREHLDDDPPSDEEAEARRKLIKLCKQIADDYAPERAS